MATQSYPEQSQSVIVLVLGILGLLACGLLGPVAWVMGNKELAGIDAGLRPPEQRNLANIGRILGMVTVLLYVLAFLSFGCIIALGASSN